MGMFTLATIRYARSTHPESQQNLRDETRVVVCVVEVLRLKSGFTLTTKMTTR